MSEAIPNTSQRRFTLHDVMVLSVMSAAPDPRMDAEKKACLEAAGWKVGTVAEFLGLNEAEEQALELRVQIARAVRRLRHAAGMTQADLAKRLKISQARVVDIEQAVGTLDSLVRAFFMLGGTLGRLDELGMPLTPEERIERVAGSKIKAAAKAAKLTAGAKSMAPVGMQQKARGTRGGRRKQA